MMANCSNCGESIQGDTFTKSGNIDCEDCRQCANLHCKTESFSEGQTRFLGDVFCLACFNSLLHQCQVCLHKIQQQCDRKDWRKSARSKADIAVCYSCGMALCQEFTAGNQNLTDQRKICPACFQHSVNFVRQGRPILSAIIRVFKTYELNFNPRMLSIRLVSEKELKHLRNAKEKDALQGLAIGTKKFLGKEEIQRNIKEIVILDRLPGEYFATILAHELGHAWLFMNQYPTLPKLVEEGLAEMFAYLWLKEQNSNFAPFRIWQMENNSYRENREGFRIVKNLIEQQYHPFDLLEYVKRKNRFPQ